MAAEHVEYIQTYMQPFADTYMQPRYRSDAVDLALARYHECFAWTNYFQANNIPFMHAILIYALTFTKPWSDGVRQTPTGFVPPEVWIRNNYYRFRTTLEEYDEGESPPPGNGEFSPPITLTYDATVSGEQVVTLTAAPLYYELQINGLGQRTNACTVVGAVLTIPSAYQIESGDTVTIKYNTEVEEETTP